MMNSFVKANTFDAGANNSMTENGAVSYCTFGTYMTNQFGKSASYRGRSIERVWEDQSMLWSEDASAALKFPFYLRLITRQTNIMGGNKTERVQRGAGVRDESFKRLLWIAKYHPEEFYRNLWLLPVVGSWKDIWTLLSFDGASEYLNEQKFFEVIAEGINDKNHKDLVKKYMPRIRSDKKCTTDWAKSTNNLAKRFAKLVGWTYKDYRIFKTSGKAHDFQTIICKGLYENLNWDTIPGKALLNMVSGDFIKKHNLTESYIEWIESKPVANFNGYAFELGRKIKQCGHSGPSLALKHTIDKQFDNLIETAKKDNGAIKGNVLCALDTSASMGTTNIDKAGTTPFDVCLSLGIYFSELNTGAFHNTVVMFDDESTLLSLKGKTFTEKWSEINSQKTAWGSTNFQSVINLLVDTRKNHPEIALEDYPTTLLVVSDMQFNPSNHSYMPYSSEKEKTNYEEAMSKLEEVFPEDFVKNFKIIWWYCTNKETKDFPSTMEKAGTYMFSGFDGAVVSFLLGGSENSNTDEKTIPSMEEIIKSAFEQEVLALIH